MFISKYDIEELLNEFKNNETYFFFRLEGFIKNKLQEEGCVIIPEYFTDWFNQNVTCKLKNKVSNVFLNESLFADITKKINSEMLLILNQYNYGLMQEDVFSLIPPDLKDKYNKLIQDKFTELSGIEELPEWAEEYVAENLSECFDAQLNHLIAYLTLQANSLIGESLQGDKTDV